MYRIGVEGIGTQIEVIMALMHACLYSCLSRQVSKICNLCMRLEETVVQLCIMLGAGVLTNYVHKCAMCNICVIASLQDTVSSTVHSFLLTRQGEQEHM